MNFIPGVLLATAVNTTGIFVIAPEWDIAPGVSLFGGFALANKVSLTQNVTPCYGLGSSTFNLPTVSQSVTQPPTSGLPQTTVTTTIQSQTTTGCGNSDATALPTGATAPTQTNLKPGFGFGIVLNSNIFSFFGGKN